jgi:cytochrome c-type biogenesis protein
MLLDGNHISLPIAFLAGALTFVAPCILPILPAYIGYISGLSVQQAQQKKYRRLVLASTLAFTFGFLAVFMALGLTANIVGSSLHQWRWIFQRLGGVLMILVGLHLAGLFETKFFAHSLQLRLPRRLTPWQNLNAFLLGLAFGFSWTPCIGPVLAVILFWASRQTTFWSGALLLFVYGLGLSLPFVLLGFFSDRFFALLLHRKRLLQGLQIAAGIFMIVVGLVILTDQLSILSRILLPLGSLETWLFRT